MEEIKRKKKVALYIRVSTDEQGEMFGPEAQKASLMALIQSKSEEYEFAGEQYVYQDEISGTYPPEERPKFRKLMEDITLSTNKPFDIVAVYKIDRFARKLKILLDILDFFNKEDHKIEFLSAKESIDTSTPFGRAMLGIIGVIAELEAETIKERTKDGRERSAALGTYMNIPPVGYIKDDKGKIVIQKEEAKVVKMIFGMFVYERNTVEEIARYLREHKVLSPQSFRYKHGKEKKQRKLSKNGPYHWEAML